MAYDVRILPRAERDLDELFEEINVQYSEAALKWYGGLAEAIFSLQDHPARCPIIRKRDRLRHLLYGEKPNVYRVIFRILERQETVEVLHIHHGARGILKASDLM